MGFNLISRRKPPLSQFFDRELRFLLGRRELCIGSIGKLKRAPTPQLVVPPSTLPLTEVFGDDVTVHGEEVWFRRKDMLTSVFGGRFSTYMVGQFRRTGDELIFLGRFPLSPFARAFFLVVANFLLLWLILSMAVLVIVLSEGTGTVSEVGQRAALLYGSFFLFVVLLRVWLRLLELPSFFWKRKLIHGVAEIIQRAEGRQDFDTR
jgi:hypothetical protein